MKCIRSRLYGRRGRGCPGWWGGAGITSWGKSTLSIGISCKVKSRVVANSAFADPAGSDNPAVWIIRQCRMILLLPDLFSVGPNAFLVACTRLYKSLCRSVGRSVSRSVRRSVPRLLFLVLWVVFEHYCPCPTARDWFCRVYELVFSRVHATL